MIDSPEKENLLIEIDNDCLRIWFNQPDTRDALSQGLSDELRLVLVHAKQDNQLRGITLRGKGGFFCAGGDLKAFKSNFPGGGQSQRDIELASREAGDEGVVEFLDKRTPQWAVTRLEQTAADIG